MMIPSGRISKVALLFSAVGICFITVVRSPIPSIGSFQQEVTTERRNDNNVKEVPAPAISYTLYRGLNFEYTFSQFYRCDRIADPRRAPLPEAMQQSGFFDFFTRISTNLKIVMVGDSIAMQLAQAMDEAVGTKPESRRLLGFTNIDTEALYASAPVQGGGVLAGFRLQHFLTPKKNATAVNRNRRRRRLESTNITETTTDSNASSVPWMNTQFWNQEHINTLLNYNYSVTDTKTTTTSNSTEEYTTTITTTTTTTTVAPIERFDVLIQRINHGWHSLDEITLENLQNNTKLAYDLFGVKTLIFFSLHFVNNVFENSTWKLLLEKRELLRNYSRSYIPESDDVGVQNIMILNLGELHDELYEWNARCIGYNTSGVPLEDWMLGHRLSKWRPRLPYFENIAHICAEKVPDNAPGCRHNSLTQDGMHICMSTLGGRIMAGLACLMACAHNNNDDDSNPSTNRRLEALRTCEAKCNDKFMTMKPVPEEDILQWNMSSAGSNKWTS